MYLSRLTLLNFRNLVQLDLELPPGVVVFFGENAQGKTSLLEAVYLLAIARSFRAENERETVNFQAAAQLAQALVGGTIEKRGERLTVYVGYQCVAGVHPSPSAGDGLGYSVRKEVRVSRVRRTAAELVGTVNAVLFTAGDIQLVHGPPAARRRYLDVLISQADPLYLRNLQRYQRVVQQRNQLLAMLREGRAEADELAFWDDNLIREGSALTWRRQEAVGFLGPLAAQQHRELTADGEEFYMEYRPSAPLADSLQGMESQFRGCLAELRRREHATGATAVGPHRDDLKLAVNGVDMATFASRGQARTLALTLRLAEAAYLEAVRADGPIVLLDDVLSELDAGRRGRVLEKIAGYQQVLITTTDLEPLRELLGSRAAYFRVHGGSVLPHPGA